MPDDKHRPFVPEDLLYSMLIVRQIAHLVTHPVMVTQWSERFRALLDELEADVTDDEADAFTERDL
jgi:hypothetical protein